MKTQIELSKSQNGRKNRFPLASPCLTSFDVAQFRPLMVYELNAEDTIDVKLSQVCDSVPTVVKTYGSFILRQFCHWVPKRLVMRGYQEFKTGSNDPSLNHPPLWFDLSMLVNLLFNPTYVETVDGELIYSIDTETRFAKITTTGRGDFSLMAYSYVTPTEIAPVNNQYVLTARGRLLYNILVGLGYNIPQVLSFGVSFPGANTFPPNMSETYDVMPLLALGRFFYDYAYPSDYLQQQGFGSLFDGSVSSFTSSHLDKLLDLIFVGVKSDFFTQCWIRPNQKAVGSPSTPSGTVYAQPSTAPNSLSVASNANMNDLVVQQAAANLSSTLSATTQRWLEAMNDFIIRNNVGGTRFNEWLRSHFGFVTSDETCEMSSIIKQWSDVISFNGVTATTGDATQLLGQRASIGLSSGGQRIKFDAKEDGFLLFYGMMIPDTAYYQGTAPWCERLTSRYQLYTPELDGVDMEPVPYKQIASAYSEEEDFLTVLPSRQNEAFGFAPRYARRYKIPYSVMSGDFRLRSRNEGMDSYHTFRNVFYGRSQYTPLALDAQFRSADNQYDRIFAISPTLPEGTTYDPVRAFFYFDSTKWSRMLPYGDSLPFMDDDNNNGVEIDNGGTDIL